MTSASACVSCSSGSYCPNNSPSQMPCPAGSYCATPAVVPPTTCPAGSYCPGGVTAFIPCVQGSFSNVIGLSACPICSLGTFGNATGATVCTDCPFGYKCPTFGTTAPILCAAGYYAYAKFDTCYECPRGKYGSVPGTQWCSTCAAGTYTSAYASTSCLSCTKGYFSNITGMSACASCPAGTFGNTTAATMCFNCNAGSFASEQGATKCYECKTCAIDIATSNQPCAESSANDKNCTCKSNYYGPGTTCSPCPANTISEAGNTSSLLNCRCVAGFVCKYTKRIEATVHISNMTLAEFTANYQAAFLAAIAKAAGVDVSKVTFVVARSGRRLLSLWPGASMAPQELTIKFYVHDATTLNPTLPALRRTLGFVFEIEWQHDHILHVERLR